MAKTNKPSIGNYTARLKNSSNGDSLAAGLALDSLQQAVVSLASQTLPAFQSPINPALIGVNTQIVKLTSPTPTKITPNISPTQGALLVIAIQQDATGGRQITWDSSVRFASVDVFGNANSWSLFTLLGMNLGSGAQWCSIGPPLTGGS